MSATRTLRQTLIVCRKELRIRCAIDARAVVDPVQRGDRPCSRRLHDEQARRSTARRRCRIIPVVGMDRAPALVNWLNQQGACRSSKDRPMRRKRCASSAKRSW